MPDTMTPSETAPANRPKRPPRKAARQSSRVPFRAIWWAAMAGVLAPLVWLAFSAYSGGLGANPIEAVNRYLGDWALRFLLITLAMTPLRILTKQVWPVRLRRMMGLAAFFYATLHVSSYVGLDQFFDWGEIWIDIVKRRYITVGMIVIAILLSLAVTSIGSVAKRMGSKRWKRLHKLAYVAGAGACLHFFWMVKADVREPLIYAALFAGLMAVRMVNRARP